MTFYDCFNIQIFLIVIFIYYNVNQIIYWGNFPHVF